MFNMKIIKNNWIPFDGYKSINLFGIVFTRSYLNTIDTTHEEIHTKLMKEMLYIPYYIWYAIEYTIKLIIGVFKNIDAYHSVSFEQEAYNNEKVSYYPWYRTSYNWFLYVTKCVKRRSFS